MYRTDLPPRNSNTDQIIMDSFPVGDSIDDLRQWFEAMLQQSAQTFGTGILGYEEHAESKTAADVEKVDANVREPDRWDYRRTSSNETAQYDCDPLKWNTWFGLHKTLIHNKPISKAEQKTTQTLTKRTAHEALSRSLSTVLSTMRQYRNYTARNN